VAALVAGVLVALGGLLSPSLKFLFDGAWFSATLVSFAVYSALMRPAPAAEARLTPAIPETR
jgi:cytosine/uracil/thiamine/allantoin permease